MTPCGVGGTTFSLFFLLDRKRIGILQETPKTTPHETFSPHDCDGSGIAAFAVCVGQPRHTLPAPDNNCLSAQIGRYPQEKLHVTTDKDSYIVGDTIWLRAHCADAATHRPIAASRYVYVELRDARGALARRIKLLSRDSVYSGYLPTQALERFGDYSLVAYTLYMRNQGADYFFKKPLSIWPYQEDRKTQRNSSARKVTDFDVSFFPEGGYLIDGHACCVAFKALADDGGSVEVAGVLKNGRGEVLDTLRTLHGGAGELAFHTPYGRTLLRRVYVGGRPHEALRTARVGQPRQRAAGVADR